MSDGTSRNLILWFFLACFLLTIILLGWLLRPFVSIIVLAAVVTGASRPAYRIFDRLVSPSLASLLTCIVIFVVLFVPIVLFVGILSREAADLYQMGKTAVISERLSQLIEQSKVVERATVLLDRFNIRLSGEQLVATVSDLGKSLGFFLLEQSRAIAQNVLMFVINFFLMLLIVYYLLIDGQRLLSFIVELSPLPKEQDEKLIQKFKDMSSAILVGNGLGGLIQGILGGVVFALFGLKSPVLWGVIMGLLAFLPILGIGLVFIPAAVYLLLIGRVAAAIFFVAFYILLSGGIEYLFKPRVVGKRVQMHTLLVFMAIIGGLKLFGILGIIYGPLVVTAFLTMTDIYYASYQQLVDPVKFDDG